MGLAVFKVDLDSSVCWIIRTMDMCIGRVIDQQ